MDDGQAVAENIDPRTSSNSEEDEGLLDILVEVQRALPANSDVCDTGLIARNVATDFEKPERRQQMMNSDELTFDVSHPAVRGYTYSISACASSSSTPI